MIYVALEEEPPPFLTDIFAFESGSRNDRGTIKRTTGCSAHSLSYWHAARMTSPGIVSQIVVTSE